MTQDTAQRRAAEQAAVATEDILDAINQLAYPGATIKRAVSRVIKQARREALEEAVKVCNDFREQARHQDLSGRYTAKLIANQLDRLREGVEG